jgi:hypothetical protein
MPAAHEIDDPWMHSSTRREIRYRPRHGDVHRVDRGRPRVSALRRRQQPEEHSAGMGRQEPADRHGGLPGPAGPIAADLAQAAFWNAGQNCSARSRSSPTHRSRTSSSRKLAQQAGDLIVGDPSNEATVMGPADRAGRHGPGAQIHLAGGERATELASQTDYGLAATVWSHDIDAAIRRARAVSAPGAVHPAQDNLADDPLTRPDQDGSASSSASCRATLCSGVLGLGQCAVIEPLAEQRGRRVGHR